MLWASLYWHHRHYYQGKDLVNFSSNPSWIRTLTILINSSLILLRKFMKNGRLCEYRSPWLDSLFFNYSDRTYTTARTAAKRNFNSIFPVPIPSANI